MKGSSESRKVVAKERKKTRKLVEGWGKDGKRIMTTIIVRLRLRGTRGRKKEKES